MPILTQKSQVTVPKQVRVAIGVGPGDEVYFNIENNKAVLHKRARKIPFEKWKGYLGRFKTDKLINEVR